MAPQIRTIGRVDSVDFDMDDRPLLSLTTSLLIGYLPGIESVDRTGQGCESFQIVVDETIASATVLTMVNRVVDAMGGRERAYRQDPVLAGKRIAAVLSVLGRPGMAQGLEARLNEDDPLSDTHNDLFWLSSHDDDLVSPASNAVQRKGIDTVLTEIEAAQERLTPPPAAAPTTTPAVPDPERGTDGRRRMLKDRHWDIEVVVNDDGIHFRIASNNPVNVPPERWTLWAPHICDHKNGGHLILDAFFLAGDGGTADKTLRVIPIGNDIPKDTYGLHRDAERAAQLEQNGRAVMVLADDGYRIWFLPCEPVDGEEPEWECFAEYKHSNILCDRIAELIMGLP